MKKYSFLYEFSKLSGIARKTGVNRFLNIGDFVKNLDIRKTINGYLRPSKKYFNTGLILPNGGVKGKWITRQQMHEIINEILSDSIKIKNIKSNPSYLQHYIARAISVL